MVPFVDEDEEDDMAEVEAAIFRFGIENEIYK